jgi:hypothetical protein
MQELGFQACCLRCDAPDDSGLKRCSTCIQHHRTVRETVAGAPPDDPLFQLAKELMAMAATPHRHDHDEVHGEVLLEQQRLAAHLLGPTTKRTVEDVALVFEEQRIHEKANVLRDVGNQNPWKNRPPEADDAKALGEQTWGNGAPVDVHYGARTVPSKPIQTVDRSDRLGEDTQLTDRVHAAASQSEKDERVAEIFEALDFKERQQRRAALKSAMDDVKKMVNDDLDF